MSSTGLLGELIAEYKGMPKEDLAKHKEMLHAQLGKPLWVPNPGPQTDAYFSQADVLLYGGEPGGGKLLDSSYLVPVPLNTDPSGYKRHGDLKAGDEVFGIDGATKKVIKRHPTSYDQVAYEIEFSTGEKVKACADHNWLTWTHRDRKRELRSSPEWRANRKKNRPSRAQKNPVKPSSAANITKLNTERNYSILGPEPSVKTTQQIYETLYGSDGRANHSIDVIKPVDVPDIDLPCDPYLFGLWLGDGYTRSPRIIMMESDWASLKRHIPTPAHIEETSKDGRQPLQTWRFKQLQFIKHLGAKHIPPVFLRASYKQRLELLRGMMDTDGCCDKRGQCELGFSNKRLTEGALDIINSLGIKGVMRRKPMEKREHADHYRIKFIANEPVFKLERKAERQKPVNRATCNRRYIVNVSPCEAIEMNCLTVEDGLYCIGREYIATHNTALLLGLAFCEHRRSLIMRQQYTDLGNITEEAIKLNGSRLGYNGSPPPKLKRSNGSMIEFFAASKPGDEQHRQGNPFDFLGIDEATQLAASQILFLMGWLRSTDPGQRKRVVLATNPPLVSVGYWVFVWFAPWLDPQFPDPAEYGELRWAYTDDNDNLVWVDGPDPVEYNDRITHPKSFTYIPASLTDNPFLADTGYEKQLDNLPSEVRRVLMGGFNEQLRDQEFQVIPTSWIKEAQARWSPVPPRGVPMCAMGVDCSGGGKDPLVIAPRYDGWYDALKVIHGDDLDMKRLGAISAGHVVSHRKDDADVIVDMGGGYGGPLFEKLEENGIEAFAYKGAEKTARRTKEGKLKFTNTRSAAYWLFREALDPDQESGSPICLPDGDQELVADLTAPTFEVTPQGIKIEAKDKVVERLGRSTDKGDAVVMAWWKGAKWVTHNQVWINSAEHGIKTQSTRPTTVLGHKSARKKLRKRN